MLNEAIEIDSIEKVREPIMDYAKNNDKLYISTKQKKYCINYTLENEEKSFNLLKDSITLFEREKNENIREIKTFNKFLALAIGYALFFIVLGCLLSSFIPLIFTIPSLIFGTRSFNNLKELKEENEKVLYDLYVQDLNLKNRELELNKNRTIEKEKQIKQQEIENLEKQIEQLNIKFGNKKQKPKQKVLSLK